MLILNRERVTEYEKKMGTFDQNNDDQPVCCRIFRMAMNRLLCWVGIYKRLVIKKGVGTGRKEFKLCCILFRF